jgi:hypothetical protein
MIVQYIKINVIRTTCVLFLPIGVTLIPDPFYLIACSILMRYEVWKLILQEEEQNRSGSA